MRERTLAVQFRSGTDGGSERYRPDRERPVVEEAAARARREHGA